MEYFYCKSWFRAKKVATQIWSREQAAAAHAERKPYTVLVSSEARPSAFIEVRKDDVFVGFLDERLRENLSYSFKTLREGRLFLSMATYRDFREDSDTVVSGTSYIFKEDGTLAIRRQKFIPASLEIADGTTDVSGNYDTYPAFDHYDSLLTVERG